MRRLIIRPGGIGDCILSLPAMQHLRADYTEVWTRAAMFPLIHFADRLRPIAAMGLNLLGVTNSHAAELTETLRSFDSIFSWYGAGSAEFREAVERLSLPVEFHPPVPTDSSMHAADAFMIQAGGPLPAVPHIQCPPRGPGPVFIHPFSSSIRKNWPIDRYSRLAESLNQPVEWYAGLEEVEWSAGPEEQLENTVRFDSLYDLACHVSAARLYIGNDSGITHLAAIAGAPVLALFGPTDPAVWGPRSERSQIIRAASMEDIPLADVAAAAMALSALR